MLSIFLRVWQFGVVVSLLAGMAGTASSQGMPRNLLASGQSTSSLAPTSAPAVRPPARPETPQWSGQSGASGHPTMTAEAIRAASRNFPHCLQGLWPQAARRGVSRALFEAQTAHLTPDLRIMDLLDSQPEFTRSVWDYLDLLVSEKRIETGRAMLARHRATFDAVEARFEVDRHVIAAIWGIESNYGTQGGDRSVIRSTATLACVGRRQRYFRDEFLAALEILARGDVRPEDLKGSWAGAFGPTQFMPTSFKRYAIDFDGDRRRDVVNSIPDVIGSTANNLRRDGWVGGHTWGYEVVVPKGFNYLLADRARQHSLAEWERAGVRRVAGKDFPRAGDRAYLLTPAGARGPGFLMLHNFRVIMRYNPSEAYALAIGHLADRLRGGDTFVQNWPRDERVLSRAERYELQQRLERHGYDVGEPDGRLGTRTRAALRRYQADAGHIPDGFASATILERLRGR